MACPYIYIPPHADDAPPDPAVHGPHLHPHPHPHQQQQYEEEETLPFHPYYHPYAAAAAAHDGLVLCNAQASEDVADFYRRDNPLIRFNRAGALGARCLPPAWCVLVGWLRWVGGGEKGGFDSR